MKRFVTFAVILWAAAFAAAPATAGSGGMGPLRPTVGQAIAFDKSQPLRDMPLYVRGLDGSSRAAIDRGAAPVGNLSYSRDGALQRGGEAVSAGAMPSPLFTFEGPANDDNFRIFARRVNPPDPNGDVSKDNFVAMVNLTFAVYSKTGTLLFGPADTGALWQNFAVPDCTDPSGDPIVLFDEKAKRWILTQFTTRGPEFFNCVAVSQTKDPLGAYFRYAFSTGLNFPDYPKYGVWPNEDGGGSLTITTREFDPADNESIGVYAVNREELLAGDPATHVISFQLTGPPNLVGDGLLPADADGNRPPPDGAPQVILGTQDDGGFDGATVDALNVFQLRANFDNPGASTFLLHSQLPTAPFDSIFPCTPTSRDCIPQPGINTAADPRKLDILSYRQRPTWRLQYRNFGGYDSLVTNQSVEARPGIAGVRWYELRNAENPVIHQQGTFSPNDDIHRWMGSAAQDKDGNLAVGYSVSDGTTTFPGIRYAGRLAGDPLGQLPQAEAVLQNGVGVQTTTNSRWGDYTALTVDPADGCTFYYINEYYPVSGTPADGRPWHTRIGAFKFPSCS